MFSARLLHRQISVRVRFALSSFENGSGNDCLAECSSLFYVTHKINAGKNIRFQSRTARLHLIRFVDPNFNLYLSRIRWCFLKWTKPRSIRNFSESISALRTLSAKHHALPDQHKNQFQFCFRDNYDQIEIDNSIVKVTNHFLFSHLQETVPRQKEFRLKFQWKTTSMSLCHLFTFQE